MSYATKAIAGNLADVEVSDSDVTGTVQYAFSGTKELVGVYIDNSSGSNPAYLRFWDATGGVTNGTTDPVHIFYAPGNTARMYSIPLGLPFSTGVAYAGSNSAGTAGTADPSTTVTLRLLLKS